MEDSAVTRVTQAKAIKPACNGSHGLASLRERPVSLSWKNSGILGPARILLPLNYALDGWFHAAAPEKAQDRITERIEGRRFALQLAISAETHLPNRKPVNLFF
jgi:hypothetical protein